MRPELVKSFPPTQVILVDEKRDYEIERDERMKLLAVPLWQIDAVARRQEHVLTAMGCSPISCPTRSHCAGARGGSSSKSPCCGMSRPFACSPRGTTASYPKTLAEISVPLPLDPVSGQPFVYHVDGATAHIRGGSLRATRRNRRWIVHYAVTLRSDSRVRA